MTRLIDADDLKGVIETYRPALIYNNKTDIKNKMVDYFLDEIDNAQGVEFSLLPLSGEADSAYMRGYEVGKAEGLLKANARPKGEWKLHGMIYYCSECGHDCGESGDNFCGNCGADMRGGAE